MKKILVLGILLLTVISVKSQSYIGFLTDNYSGVHSVINNPANIADSRYKVDINLVGISAFAGNDYYGFNFSDLLGSDYSLESDATTFLKDQNNIGGNLDVLGPSFMFNINRKNSIALFSRARVFFGVNEVNGEILGNIANGFEDRTDFSADQGNLFFSSNGWAEVGLTYATVLMNRDEHFLKGGVSIKYLQGLGSGYAQAQNLTYNFDADGTTATEGTIQTTGEFTYGYSENLRNGFDNLEPVSGATGIGADIGFTYEWRPNYKKFAAKNKEGKTFIRRDANVYKLKLGVSLTDFGSINYSGGIEERYDLNNTLSQSQFETIGLDNLDQLGTLYTVTSTDENSKSNLPTAVHINADWNIDKKFYLNLNGDIAVASPSKLNTSSITNMVSLTPRYESKWFSFYLPASYAQYSGVQVGAGLRLGPLYVGSGSIVSLLINDESKAADVYAGLKIPIYHNAPKDKDGDGVLDKVDECPNTRGPKDNNGCPWEDSDGDGVLDKDDKCPEQPGEKDNDGCPWLDTDGDTVLDKDDSCPNEFGDNGCPEVTEEVQKRLNAYAAQVLFDSGKSSIKDQSFEKLKEILAILAEYPNAKFTIEGHTDSQGKASSNQRLSDSRANAVQKYLIDNGVNKFRLSAVGYGEDRPIASNKTRKGRAENRRVEINLVKED